MGKGVKVDWQKSSEELKQLYQKEVHPQRRTRLQAFWQLSQGKRIQDVVDTTGASYRSMEQWLRWYRRGGLGEVLRRVVGHQAKGKKPYLNPLQQRALVAKVQLGQFRTVWDAKEWVWERWGVRYTYKRAFPIRRGLCGPRGEDHPLSGCCPCRKSSRPFGDEGQSPRQCRWSI